MYVVCAMKKSKSKKRPVAFVLRWHATIPRRKKKRPRVGKYAADAADMIEYMEMLSKLLPKQKTGWKPVAGFIKESIVGQERKRRR